MKLDMRQTERLPMSPRMHATLIMERLRYGGLRVPLVDKDGHTVQDIITSQIELAIEDAAREMLSSLQELVDLAVSRIATDRDWTEAIDRASDVIARTHSATESAGGKR